jgi:hypothetical protein
MVAQEDMTSCVWYRVLLQKLLAPLQGPLGRERERIRAAILEIHGLMPLLMKQRNGVRWTADERALLSRHLRSLISLSPYLIVLLAPGSFMLFPVVAWWLDRRRLKRGSGQTNVSPTAKASDLRP